MPIRQKKSRQSTRRKSLPQAVEGSAPEKDYEVFIRGLALIGLGLKTCSANIDRRAFFECLRKNRELTQEYSADYSLTDCGKEYFDCEGRFSAVVRNSKEQVLLSVECVFHVHMHSKQDVDPKLAKRFSQSELKLLLLPYARNFVTDTTARMSVPPVVIPLTTLRSAE